MYQILATRATSSSEGVRGAVGYDVGVDDNCGNRGDTVPGQGLWEWMAMAAAASSGTAT